MELWFLKKIYWNYSWFSLSHRHHARVVFNIIDTHTCRACDGLLFSGAPARIHNRSFLQCFSPHWLFSKLWKRSLEIYIFFHTIFSLVSLTCVIFIGLWGSPPTPHLRHQGYGCTYKLALLNYTSKCLVNILVPAWRLQVLCQTKQKLTPSIFQHTL